MSVRLCRSEETSVECHPHQRQDNVSGSASSINRTKTSLARILDRCTRTITSTPRSFLFQLQLTERDEPVIFGAKDDATRKVPALIHVTCSRSTRLDLARRYERGSKKTDHRQPKCADVVVSLRRFGRTDLSPMFSAQFGSHASARISRDFIPCFARGYQKRSSPSLLIAASAALRFRCHVHSLFRHCKFLSSIRKQ